MVASFINAAPDLKWEMQGAPVALGDHVGVGWEVYGTKTRAGGAGPAAGAKLGAFYVTFSPTNRGAGGAGTAAANKAFSFTGASMFEIKDGAIVHQSDYYDALGFFKQLGWL